jgi:ADP-ribose pyrophosphatase
MTRKMPDTILPWQVVASSVTYEDRWLRVRSDHGLTPRGVQVSPYHVIEYPDWVNVVALTRETLELVLVREYRHGRREVVTGLVSGTVELADAARPTDPAEAAARRELYEETGYRANELKKLLVSYPNPANQNNLVTSYLALDVDPGDDRSLDASEDIELVLAEMPEVMLRLRSGELRMQAMHVAALWSACAHIIAGDMPTAAALREKLAAALGVT